MEPKIDKRVALVRSADKLFLKKGVAETTLADIAIESSIPLGNIYYYFKRKEDIILEIIKKKTVVVNNFTEELSKDGNPKSRLRAFVHFCLDDTLDESLKISNILFTFVSELPKASESVVFGMSSLLQTLTEWCAKQFLATGRGDKSIDYAKHLMVTVQGLILMQTSSVEFDTQPHQALLAENLGFS